jgi:hypothetical protein
MALRKVGVKVVPAWSRANTLEASFCVTVVDRAMDEHVRWSPSVGQRIG